MKNNLLILDRRVVEKNLRAGKISTEEYEKYLKSLKNMENESELVSIDDVAPKSYLVSMGLINEESEEPSPEDEENEEE
jgi:hypothetical protein